ncbi:MAG: hypothetical protein GC158_08260 [Cyanobacteria bacterium RI_101]|jgi:hypothetical protein|nr:hypothetical protein [Cyanobacteria bacterium RI_101]
MSQKDNFSGGFIFGALVGGVLGGAIGAVLANRRPQTPEEKLPLGELPLDSEENIELARRRLEDKIAQLNGAIDEVRLQLGTVNSRGETNPEER